MKKVISISLLSLILVVTLGHAYPIDHQIVFPSDGEDRDRFGTAIDIDDNIAIISSPGAEVNGEEVGAAYVFSYYRGQWVEEAKLVANDAEEDVYFGWDVAIQGGVAVISAMEKTIGGRSDRGAVYVFERNNENEWVQTAMLVSPYAPRLMWFGEQIDIDNQNIAVLQSEFNAIYVFAKDDDEWLLSDSLRAVSDEQNLCLGFSDIDISDGKIVAPIYYYDSEYYLGVVVFVRDEGVWQQDTTLYPNWLGGDHSASLNENRLVIGTPERPHRSARGRLYIYDYYDNEWEFQQEISSLVRAKQFKKNLCSTSDLIVFSSPPDVQILRNEGGNWNHFVALRPDNQESGFGYVTTTEGWLACTDPGGMQGRDRTGSVYFYKMDDIRAVESDAENINIPHTLTVNSVYPNPFNSTTNISFSLPRAGNARVTVYDTMGRMVAELLERKLTAGSHNVIWDAGKASAGVYIVNVSTSEESRTQKVVLVR